MKRMKKNNIKYMIFALALIGISLTLNDSTFYTNTIFIYDHFDITGVAKTIQRGITIILMSISIICLVESIKVKEKGVNFLFNKCMVCVFIIYTILSLGTYIYVRSYEEKIATKMQDDIKNYSQIVKQNQLDKGNVKNRKIFKFDFYNTISKSLAETEYKMKDEHYERKKEIIKQIENSSNIERYTSMSILNPTYKCYGSYMIDEVKYYETFFKCFLIGIVGTVFYLFNIRAKEIAKY